jgi:hypothetical protein
MFALQSTSCGLLLLWLLLCTTAAALANAAENGATAGETNSHVNRGERVRVGKGNYGKARLVDERHGNVVDRPQKQPDTVKRERRAPVSSEGMNA